MKLNDLLNLDALNLSVFSRESLESFYESNKRLILGIACGSVSLFLLRKFYFAGGVCKSKRRLDGKTVIITGANTGIGKETAIDLAKRGARVILACRDLNRAQKAAQEVRKKSGNGNVVIEVLDLASLASVRAFAQRILAQEQRIDILVNNAGIMMCPRWETCDGFEMQFGTNHLGHFLLTNLLLDKIKASAPSRIINVSSLAHERAKMHWDDLMWSINYSPMKAYGQSKLANVLFTRELAKRLEGSRVTVNALHPGVVATELGRYMSETFGFLFKFFFYPLVPFFLIVNKTPYQGAQTNIYCAVDEGLESVSGRYFSDCKEKKLLPHALNDGDARRLWDISEKLTKH